MKRAVFSIIACCFIVSGCKREEEELVHKICNGDFSTYQLYTGCGRHEKIVRQCVRQFAFLGRR